MNDELIKRSDAIQAIMDLPNAENGYSDTYDKQTVLNVIEDVPKTDYSWIPVSERLPDKECDYLITIKEWHSDYIDVARFSNGKWDYINFINNDEITAWMPLPQPYEPQEREE